MAESISRPDREAWIIKLELSVDPGKVTRNADGSGTAEVYTSYNRIIHPAKCEKKILKNIGFDSTLDNFFQPEINTGKRTLTGVIISDHLSKKVYLCRTAPFLNHDVNGQKQVNSVRLFIKPWWFGIPVNTLAYLAVAVARPEIITYTGYEVGFVVEQKSNLGFNKQDPSIRIEESTAADDLMAIFSRPASTLHIDVPDDPAPSDKESPGNVEIKGSLPPTPSQATGICAHCGAKNERPGAKFCSECGARFDLASGGSGEPDTRNEAAIPDSANARNNKGISPEKSESYYNRLDPVTADTFYYSAQRFKDEGRKEEALAAIGHAIHFNPDRYDLWFFKGTLLVEAGKYDDASGAVAQTLELKPDFAHAWYAMGCLALHFGKRPDALACFKQVIKYATPSDANFVRFAQNEFPELR